MVLDLQIKNKKQKWLNSYAENGRRETQLYVVCSGLVSQSSRI